MSTERVSETDFALVQSAMAEVRAAESQLMTAQTLVQFAQRHLGKVYKLQKGDRVEDDGTIIRVPHPRDMKEGPGDDTPSA